MTKKNKFVFHNDVGWGNRPINSVSDEKLLNTNWNRVAGVREYYNNETADQKKIRGQKISKIKKLKHPTKGKPNTKEQKEKISKTLAGKKKPPRSKKHRQAYMKPLMTPDGPFESTKAATTHYDYKWAENCTNKIKKNHPGWYWITREEYDKLKKK